jgi:hypothetical protein
MSDPVLILRRANASRISGSWQQEDYDVFDGDHDVGRINYRRAFSRIACEVAGNSQTTTLDQKGPSPKHAFESRSDRNLSPTRTPMRSKSKSCWLRPKPEKAAAA